MGIRSRLKFYRKVNWFKTIYFNFRKFPFSAARKLPVFFYGPVKLQDISGEIVINAPLERAMIGFGQPYELNSVHKGTAELVLSGRIIFNGHVQFGKDCLVYIAKDAVLQFGHMSSLASNGKIICTKSIALGTYARLGSECQLIDTTFHTMVNTQTGERFPANGDIVLGNFNYVANRVSIMKGTTTPDYCTIASNSVCNKDYLSLGNNILIGGVPSKLIKSNIVRDWDGEKEDMKRWLKIKY
jgi:acetyltransferase-like isoleucine patch superfamily enzyme